MPIPPAARRARQRAAAVEFGVFLRRRSVRQEADDRAPIEASNDVARRDAEW